MEIKMTAQSLQNYQDANQSATKSDEEFISEVDLLTFKTVMLNQAQDNNLGLEAAIYHLKSGGHKVRARLAYKSAISLGMNQADAVVISSASELIHNASLIHDDIQDSDVSRRDLETVWSRYGEDIAICAGDLLISAAYGVLANFTQHQHLPLLIGKLHQNTALAIKGQSADIFYKSHKLSNIEIYKEIAIAKSGALLSLPLELSLIGSNNSEFTKIACNAAESFAIGYQVIDDLSDIEKDSAHHILNITSVFDSSYGVSQAIIEAQALATHHLDQSIQLSKQLPKNSGQLLIDLAQQLKCKLIH